jgi:hemolysin activation/secretion protein
MLARLDLRFRPTGEWDAGALMLFVDGAHGRQRREHGPDASASLMSAGVGWDHRLFGQLGTQLLLAWPIGSDADVATGGRGVRILLSLEYQP